MRKESRQVIDNIQNIYDDNWNIFKVPVTNLLPELRFLGVEVPPRNLGKVIKSLSSIYKVSTRNVYGKIKFSSCSTNSLSELKYSLARSPQ